ncbi:uncharacterized protein isoform X3 [Castor canadensis]|uniref:Uncharacterized protein isoform X3 n=1 Tax=Castor canadensis TaxID=51338 RepID=A0AC58LJB5_CASCN
MKLLSSEVIPQEEPEEAKSQRAKPQEPNPEWMMVTSQKKWADSLPDLEEVPEMDKKSTTTMKTGSILSHGEEVTCWLYSREH